MYGRPPKDPSGAWKAVIRKTGWPTSIKTFRTKRDAEDWARRTEDEMVRGVFIDRAASGRMHMRIDLRLKALVAMEARRRRITERAIVEAALRERYEPEQAKQEDSLLLAEVRGLRRDLGRVEFGHRILVELFTLTVHNLFQRLPSPTDASRLAGTAFYNALVASVEKVFTQGDPLLDKLAESLLEPSGSSTTMDGAADATVSLEP